MRFESSSLSALSALSTSTLDTGARDLDEKLYFASRQGPAVRILGTLCSGALPSGVRSLLEERGAPT